MIVAPDGCDGLLRAQAAEYSHSELRTYSGDSDEPLEETLLLTLKEPEKSKRILAHLGMDVQGRLAVFRWERRIGGHADDDLIADPTRFYNGLARLLVDEFAAKMRNHRV